MKIVAFYLFLSFAVYERSLLRDIFHQYLGDEKNSWVAAAKAIGSQPSPFLLSMFMVTQGLRAPNNLYMLSFGHVRWIFVLLYFLWPFPDCMVPTAAKTASISCLTNLGQVCESRAWTYSVVAANIPIYDQADQTIWF